MRIIFVFYLLFGVVFYLDFMRKLDEVGGYDAIQGLMGDDWDNSIDFSSPGAQFLTFVICVTLWPLFLILPRIN